VPFSNSLFETFSDVSSIRMSLIISCHHATAGALMIASAMNCQAVDLCAS